MRDFYGEYLSQKYRGKSSHANGYHPIFRISLVIFASNLKFCQSENSDLHFLPKWFGSGGIICFWPVKQLSPPADVI